MRWLAADLYQFLSTGIFITLYFDIYEGREIVDGRDFIIPVHVGPQLPEILFGRQWLTLMKLAIDERNGILTLEYVGD